MQAPSWTEFLQCSICMSKYNCTTVVPISLSCSHTMCKKCISKLKANACPYDRAPIPPNTDIYPPNTALLLLLGYQPQEWDCELSSISQSVLPDSDIEMYSNAREATEQLALFLKPFVDQGVLQATICIPRPVLKKLVSLLSCQILDGEGRGRALKAANSIAERTITELLIMHQNQQQISSLLWTAVRSRGCQFLGPVMQEEGLKLILKVLESGRFLSRKNIVLYVVQQLHHDFPNASKTNIGHVVQLLYRASCFNVEKRDDESSLMQLKEEYRTYESLRREHDSQIIKIAMEAGLRITPETWSTQLYGNTSRKSDMQSIIDKLVSQGVASSGLSELIVAIRRSQDPYNLSEKLVPHLDTLLKIVNIVGCEKMSEKSEKVVTDFVDWDMYVKAVSELLKTLQVFTEFTQIQSGRYKTGMCPHLIKPGGCPKGVMCPYAHSEEERKKYINIARTNQKVPKRKESRQQPAARPSQMIARGDGVGGAGSTSLPQYLDYSSTGDPYQQPSGGSLQSGNIMFDNYMVNNTGTTPHNQGFIPVLPDSYNASNLGTSYSVQASQHRADPMGQYYDRSTSNDYLYSTGKTPGPVPKGPSSRQYSTYNSYDPPTAEYDLQKGGDLSSVENEYKPVSSHSSMFNPSLSSGEDDSWKYHGKEEQDLPTSAARYGTSQGAEGSSGRDSPVLNHNMSKVSVRDQEGEGGDKHHHGDATQGKQGVDVNQLQARIELLEQQLAKERGGKQEEQQQQQYPQVPPYYSSPHNTEILSYPPYYSPTHTGIIDPSANTGYNPMTGLRQPQWSGSLVSPSGSVHSTPPNTSLIIAPPPMVHTPIPNVMQQYQQLQSDNMIAHYLQFYEQSKAITGGGPYPIAPGAHLSSNPSHAPPQYLPHHQRAFNYGAPQFVGKPMLK